MCLIRDIDSHAARQAILRGVLGIARDLDVEVIAEGIETLAEFETLRCDGHYGSSRGTCSQSHSSKDFAGRGRRLLGRQGRRRVRCCAWPEPPTRSAFRRCEPPTRVLHVKRPRQPARLLSASGLVDLDRLEPATSEHACVRRCRALAHRNCGGLQRDRVPPRRPVTRQRHRRTHYFSTTAQCMNNFMVAQRFEDEANT